MAELWLAELETKEGFEGFSRQVAIKAVRAQFADDPSFREMFVAEAELSARVLHPNVIRVENVGAHAGRPYLAMELIEGRSLEELLLALGRRGQRLRPALAVWIVGQVLDGLHAAHGAVDGRTGDALRIVHRDVSPPNVMLSRDGAVKVVDFGVAKAARALGPRTEPGTVKGKPAYMSPEQARGDSGQVDHRTDVYAAAIVLWEALTGRRLFKGPNANATLRQAMFPELVAPSAYAPQVSPELDAVVLRGLATEPADRPASAAELKRELLGVERGAKEDRRETLAELVQALVDADEGAVETAFPSGATLADASAGLEDGDLPSMSPVHPVRHDDEPPTTRRVRGPKAPPARTRGRRLGLVLLALVALVAVALALRAWTSEPELIAARVASSVEGELRIDGRARGRIGPSVELVFELPRGLHRFAVATDDGMLLARDADLRTGTRIELGLPASARVEERAEAGADAETPTGVEGSPGSAPEAVPEVDPEAGAAGVAGAGADGEGGTEASRPAQLELDLDAVLARCRNDAACRVEALAGRARSPLERATLIQAYRNLGRTDAMTAEMRAFLEAHPDALQASSYRRQLE